MSEQISFGDLLAEAIAAFKRHEISNAGFDARVLLEAASGMSHAQLISNSRDSVSLDVERSYRFYIEKRIKGLPVHRILQAREFYGRVFKLSDATLIPRPETELLVDRVIEYSRTVQGEFSVLDMGTGSGAIGVSIAGECPKARVTACDISQEALSTAMQNAVALGVAQRVECIHSDMFTNILRNESVVYDVIVSNPPYIPTDDLDGLQREVRDYDPAAALDGGKDGLDFYRVLFGDAKRYLTPNGIILVEFGIGQSVDITDIASAAGWHDISVYQDLSGIERVLQANL